MEAAMKEPTTPSQLAADPDAPDAFGRVSVETMARMLGVKPGTLRNWVARREIPFVKKGRATMFFPDSVQEWLKAKEFMPRDRH